MTRNAHRDAIRARAAWRAEIERRAARCKQDRGSAILPTAPKPPPSFSQEITRHEFSAARSPRRCARSR